MNKFEIKIKGNKLDLFLNDKKLYRDILFIKSYFYCKGYNSITETEGRKKYLSFGFNNPDWIKIISNIEKWIDEFKNNRFKVGMFQTNDNYKDVPYYLIDTYSSNNWFLRDNKVFIESEVLRKLYLIKDKKLLLINDNNKIFKIAKKMCDLLQIDYIV
jgi:hypothetical protein